MFEPIHFSSFYFLISKHPFINIYFPIYIPIITEEIHKIEEQLWKQCLYLGLSSGFGGVRQQCLYLGLSSGFGGVRQQCLYLGLSSGFGGVRLARSLAFYVIVVPLSCFFRLVILWFTTSDNYLFGIFKPFLHKMFITLLGDTERNMRFVYNFAGWHRT